MQPTTFMAPTASPPWVWADALSRSLAWFVFRENFDRRIALGMAFISGGVLREGAGGGRREQAVALLAGSHLPPPPTAWPPVPWA